jgi:hypothetical protein
MMVAEEIQESFVIEGVAPVSMRSIDGRLLALEERIISQLQGSERVENTPQQTENECKWNTWYWGDGQFCHFVPHNWELPRRLERLWEYWWCGDKTLGIKPFCRINFSHELKHDNARISYSRASAVMEYCVKVATEKELVSNQFSCIPKLSLEEKDSIFERLFRYVIKNLYHGKKEPGRPLEVCYGTLYSKLPRNKKRRRQTSSR